jgi:DNA-binding GntR family transcriptional regulator
VDGNPVLRATLADDGWSLPRQRSLPEAVADRIVEAIRTGELKPGERIVEVQLAKRLGVSRAPLREALKSLEAKHLVESRRGHGTYVAPVSGEDAAHIMVLRANLESLAARLVAANLTPEMLATLTAKTREMERVAKSGNTAVWRDLDWQFHETVCRYSGNAYLLSAWHSISNLVWVFLHTHPAFERARPQVINNHRAMLEALASRDPDRAERAFRNAILTSAFARLGIDVPPALATLVAQHKAPGEPAPERTRASRRPRAK